MLTMLTILVIIRDYANETAMFLDKCTFAKEVNLKPLRWLVAVADKVSFSATLGSVIGMILDQNNRKNDIFDFSKNSLEASLFKNSR